MSAWETNFLKKWWWLRFPSAKTAGIWDWSKSTNKEKPAEYRNLDKIKIKRFDNVFGIIKMNKLDGFGNEFSFKTPLLLTRFGLSFVSWFDISRFGGTFYYNKKSWENYWNWNKEKNKHHDLKQIISSVDVGKLKLDYTYF